MSLDISKKSMHGAKSYTWTHSFVASFAKHSNRPLVSNEFGDNVTKRRTIEKSFQKNEQD
jgi:hypothetical protein